MTALLVFVAVSVPRHGGTGKSSVHKPAMVNATMPSDDQTGADKSLLPITDSGRPSPKEGHNGFLNERDLERTANRGASRTSQTPQAITPGSLGSIAPFGGQYWQAPPYQPDSKSGTTDPDKAERDAMEKSALVYVGKVSSNPAGDSPGTNYEGPELALGLGLALGTRLRARLESAASSAVRTPVIAVIEYNYERDGAIVIPAGTKAIGHIRDANRSGYVDIQFDSLLMPDGMSLPIEAAATGLDLKPLRGKVEGKNTGKNILVRSLSGIGQAGSMLVGQNSMNQPLNESDLIRERMNSNIGEAGDEEVSRLMVNQRITVTVPAGAPIYVILQQPPKPEKRAAVGYDHSAEASAGVEQLQELLRLQRELNDAQRSQGAQ